MSFGMRLLVVSLSVFALTCLAVSPLIPLALRRMRSVAPSVRASTLLKLRWVPLSLALAASAITLVSFYFFEQRDAPESTGLVLQLLAALATAMWAVAMLKATVGFLATRRLVREWTAVASPITLPETRLPAFVIDHVFPMVAVVGIMRPRLFIARSVVEACPPAELRAILAHEQQHVEARDNLRRRLLSATPDLLAWLPISRRLREAWHDAAEEAADDAAGKLGDDGRVVLAEALIRVARLASGRDLAHALPASALYRGEDLERRIRRLLAPRPEPIVTTLSPARRALVWAAVFGGCAVMLQAVHVILEMAVTYLP